MHAGDLKQFIRVKLSNYVLYYSDTSFFRWTQRMMSKCHYHYCYHVAYTACQCTLMAFFFFFLQVIIYSCNLTKFLSNWCCGVPTYRLECSTAILHRHYRQLCYIVVKPSLLYNNTLLPKRKFFIFFFLDINTGGGRL